MRCVECGGQTFSSTSATVPFRALPGVDLVGMQVQTCLTCGEEYTSIPALEQLIRALSEHVARQVDRLTPVELVFLRKAIGWSVDDLGRRLAVSPDDVRAWESGTGVAPKHVERMLRVLALRLDPVEAYEQLENAEGERPSRFTFDEAWHVAA